jgi:3-dehydroquinate synthase
MEPIRIDVTSERSRYPVLIGAGLTARLPELLAAHDMARELLIVSCPPVWRFHAKRLQTIANAHAPTILPDGERAKTLPTVARVYDALVKRHIDRSGAVFVSCKSPRRCCRRSTAPSAARSA